MTQYIDASAVIAEIEKMLQKEYPCDNSEQEAGYDFALYELQDFLNTLEVKEVDLEKEFDDYTKDIMACDVQFEPFTHLYNCAKYFYELGLKAKGE